MLRESSAVDSRYVMIGMANGDGYMAIRSTTGGTPAITVIPEIDAHTLIEVDRNGSQIVASTPTTMVRTGR